MNKHLIVIGMTLMLLAVGLSGCVENGAISNNKDVEIVNYNVETRWYKYWPHADEWYSEIGFCNYDLPYDDVSSLKKYVITVEVKNNAGKLLKYIDIRPSFYDLNGNEIYDGLYDIVHVYNLPNSYTDICYIEVSSGFFGIEEMNLFDNVKFEITSG